MLTFDLNQVTRMGLFFTISGFNERNRDDFITHMNYYRQQETTENSI